MRETPPMQRRRIAQAVLAPAVMSPLLLALLLFGSQPFAAAPPAAAAELPESPEDARIVTEDLARFWKAWDRARGKKETGRARAFFEEYYLPASPGLKDFIRSRIYSVYHLLDTLDAHPRYYASLRSKVPDPRQIEGPTRAAFRKLEALYPDAVFPDVYLLIGRLSSGGTTSERALLIGTEMYGLGPDTPMEELNDWLRRVLKPMDALPHIIAHESIHYQQRYPDDSTLLAAVIGEGSADFLAELISGEHINGHVHEWADPRARELWEVFRGQMSEPGFQGWLYGGDRPEGWPRDVGYWMGYQITRAYYEQAEDKRQAVHDILNIQDFEAFLAASGYADRWADEQ